MSKHDKYDGIPSVQQKRRTDQALAMKGKKRSSKKIWGMRMIPMAHQFYTGDWWFRRRCDYRYFSTERGRNSAMENGIRNRVYPMICEPCMR